MHHFSDKKHNEVCFCLLKNWQMLWEVMWWRTVAQLSVLLPVTVGAQDLETTLLTFYSQRNTQLTHTLYSKLAPHHGSELWSSLVWRIAIRFPIHLNSGHIGLQGLYCLMILQWSVHHFLSPSGQHINLPKFFQRHGLFWVDIPANWGKEVNALQDHTMPIQDRF